MIRMRRWAAVLGLGIIALVLVGLCTDRGSGQPIDKKVPGIQPGGGSGDAALHSSIKIHDDSAMRRAVEVGGDCIRDKEWKQAIEVLQKILAKEKDYYVQLTESDPNHPQNKTTRWTSVKFEANNLLGSMPLEGLQAYEVEVGADAKVLLDDAKKKGDREMLKDVAHRFCHTKAGVEANEILATLFLARGEVFAAALRYEKLLQMNPEWAKISDLTLFKASIAFRRAGDTKNSDDTWARLEVKLKGTQYLKIGTEKIPIAKLEEVWKEKTWVENFNHDWPSWRGNVLNTAQASGSPPLLDTKLWSRPMFMDKLDGFPDEDPDQLAQKRVLDVIAHVEKKNEPVLPGFFPIVSQGVMVYRNHRGLVAVALKDMQIRDEESGVISKYTPGQIVWKSIPMDRSLAMLLEKPKTLAKVGQWLQSYEQVPGFASFLYDNTMIGTVVTDHRNVYAINDLAVPPHPQAFMQNQFNPQFNQYNLGDVKSLVEQSELYAYDLFTGKLKWDLNHEDKDFKDSHFLSLPITVAGKLYVLNEKRIETPGGGQPFNGQMTNPIPGESELRLICIDPTKLVMTNGSPKPSIVGEPQTLGHVVQHNRLVQDISRRVNAVQMAYGEGMLVCPTNAGEVFGVDLMTRSLVWSYPYRESAYQQIVLPGMQNQPFPGGKNMMGGTTIVSKWRSSPPAIQDGKIVFTSPDSDSIHCVNLRDGKPLWKKAQSKGDQYFAGVYKGRALIVSDTSIRALDIKDGRQVWYIHTGDLPSGQGVASKDIYYLPLKKGEILAVDIVKGEVKAHNRAAGAGAAPGNLVFYENMVLSQTATEVAAYPQLSARLDAARLDSGNDPDNLAKLTDFGELLLKDGQVHKAVETLMKVYDRKPADPLGARVKQRLFEALTDLMHLDFNTAARDHLTVYKSLCEVPGNNVEEQNRKAKFYRLIGQGREAQGKLVEAFQMYKDFGALPIHQSNGGIASTEDPNHKIPVNVWLRGRISGMIGKATPAQREPLEATIAEEWKTVEGKKDLDAIRSFVGMFDIPFGVGREARVRLAETIMERNDRPAFLEAELSLYQVMSSEYRSDPATGGRALAALAQLEALKGSTDSMRLAAAYYRQLGRDFEKVPVRGTKTGSDLLNEMATDKRFLPFLEEATNPFGSAKISARELGAGAFKIGLTGFTLLPQGDQTPFAKQNRIILDSDPTNPKIILHDSNNQVRWTANLGNVPLNSQVLSSMYQQMNVNQAYFPNARGRFYHVKGHLIVCQVGIMVYCLDGDTGTKLWEVQTVEHQNNNQVHFQQVGFDTEGNPNLLLWNQQTQQQFRMPLGRIGAVSASYVAVLGQKGLTVRDPLRGTEMWKRTDVAMESHVFGDDQYLFLADANSNGGFGAGMTFRAIDGEVLKVPDFSNVYQARIRTLGRQILAAQPGQGVLTVRLYDILKGQDAWAKQFPLGSHVLTTEDPDITGIVDPLGQLTVLDAKTGNVLVSSNILQGRITLQDLKGLQTPLLLHDNERFYVALNKPIEFSRIVNGWLHNNFNNGTRCLTVNGWFLAVHRQDGKKQVNDREVAWKKGDFAWHSYMPMQNQLIVVDQFDQSPILLFTTRYNEFKGNGGNGFQSVTQSLNKTNGKMIYDAAKQNNGQPMFAQFQIDLKSRTINLMSYSQSVQHYVDEGKGPPALPQGAMLNRGIQDDKLTMLELKQGDVFVPNIAFPPNGFNPPVRIMRRPVIQDLPAIEVPLELPQLPKR